jgi:hypothetical protein
MKNTASTTKLDIVGTFNTLSTIQALGIVIGLAALMIVYIYRDFLFGSSVLLYTDIGSDAVNIFYPLWVQQAKLWSEHAALHGFSLETVMGMPISINPWDPFQWIVISGGTETIASRVVVAEITKSFFTAVFAFCTFHLLGFRNLTSVIGSLCFAFSGYIALGAAAWYVHSSEVVFIAMTLWAAEYALNHKRFWYAVTPLSFAFVAQNAGYLTIYLTAAIIVYSMIRALQNDELVSALRQSGLTIVCLFAGLAISYSAIDNVITSLTQSGRAEALKTVEGGLMSLKKDRSITQLVDRVELTKVVQRAYSTNALGVGNNYKGATNGGDNFLEGPLLYFGLPMVLFFPLYGVGRSRREKIVWGAMLAAVLMMLIFPWFRYAFWGFKLDYFREFTMLIGAFLLVLAMHGLDALICLRTSSQRIWTPVVVAVMLLLPFVIAKPATLIDTSQRTMTILALLGIGGCTIGYVFTRRSSLLLGVLALTMVDLSLNAHTTITERSLLTTADIRNGKLYGDASVQALEWIKGQDSDLYRVVKYAPSGPAIHASLNDAMVQGFNGLIGYSSFHNKYYLKFMSELGCSNLNIPDESKWVSRIITRPFLASFLGAKYFITKGAPLGFQPEIFPVVHRVQDQFIQRSSVAMPLMIAYDQYVTPEQFRAFDQGKMDLMLFKAVVLDPSTVASEGLPAYDLAADALKQITPADFVRAATERSAIMSVWARPTFDGIEASINLKRAGVVVISVPFDERLTVSVNGQPRKSFIANFGLLGVSVPAGTHTVDVRYAVH